VIEQVTFQEWILGTINDNHNIVKEQSFGKTEVTEIISDIIKILAVIAVIIYLFINNKDVINERFAK